MAGLLYLLLAWGFYFIVVVPLLFGLAVAGLVNLAVAKGHCRSRMVSALAGAVCGLVLYLGYYYVSMVSELGLEYASQVQLVPRYIYLRLKTDVSRDIHAPDREDNRRPPRPERFYLNLFVFGVEFIGVLAITTGSGLRRSRKPYCEGCKRWMERELTQLEPDKAPALIEAFTNSSAPSLASLCAAAPYPTLPNTTLAVEYCPSVKEGGLRSCPAYASVKSVAANSKGATFDAFDNASGKLLVRGVQLNDDEVLALLPRFKVFESTSGKTAAGALQQLGVTPPPPLTLPAAGASITPVEPEYAGRVMTRKTKLIGNAFTLIALVLLFGGLGLMAWGGTSAFPDKERADEVSPARKSFGLVLLGAGGAVFLGALGLALVEPSFFGNRYLMALLRREISSRSVRLVEPDDSEALFVEVVPKMNWGKFQLDNAADVGFLRVDRQAREILFEGDKERYRIPAAAVISCNVEFFIEGAGSHGATKLFYVVLRAHHPTTFWEAPIRERGHLGLFKTGKRKKRAAALQSAIRDILNPVAP
jgi:hypothetical protein